MGFKGRTGLLNFNLRAGTTVVMRSEHPDCVDTYEFQVIENGGSPATVVDCILSDLPEQSFRAVFDSAAMAKGTGLLAVAQTNPVSAAGDEHCQVVDGRRAYTYSSTTPPFFLSAAQAELVRRHEQIGLRFYDFLDEGEKLNLSFASVSNVPVVVDGTSRTSRVINYEGRLGQHVEVRLEVLVDTSFVRRVARSDDEFAMELVEVRTH